MCREQETVDGRCGEREVGRYRAERLRSTAGAPIDKRVAGVRPCSKSSRVKRYLPFSNSPYPELEQLFRHASSSLMHTSCTSSCASQKVSKSMTKKGRDAAYRPLRTV